MLKIVTANPIEVTIVRPVPTKHRAITSGQRDFKMYRRARPNQKQ